MKILPKKVDIDRAKAQERKLEIDNGMELAQTIDKLRRAKLDEEKSLKEWREANISKVQQEIDELIKVDENLAHKVKEAEIHRRKLLKPLNKEWDEVNEAKAKLIKDKEEVFLSSERLKLEEVELENEKKNLSDIIIRTKNKEDETDKAKGETIALKEMAQREYEVAKMEHETQTDSQERKMLELSEKEKEYEVALTTIEIRESEVKDKESELLLREQHLLSQQVSLRIAYEKLKQNATNQSN